MARLRDQYFKEGVSKLKKELEIENSLEVPRLKHITLSMCMSEAVTDRKVLERAALELEAIAGQKPLVTRARKDIANFKIRKGIPLGVKVTLRKRHMYEFFDRLVNVALPRVRDFRGVSPKCFDGAGNYTLGVKEQIIFPEINYDKVDKMRGLNVCIVTSANSNERGKALLSYLGMPFRD